MAYRLKPLEWDRERAGKRSWRAVTPFWNYYIDYFAHRPNGPTWGWAVAGANDEPCDSLEHGKQLAESHWRERVLPMLEPVDGNDPEHMLFVALDELEQRGDERVPLLRAALSQRDTAKAIAEVIARDLFTDGDERRAERLQLRHGTPDGGDRPGGGWSEGVVADHIEWRLTTADETFHPQT